MTTRSDTAGSASERACAGYRLHGKYGVPHAEIAFVLGVEERIYLNRLRRGGIDPDMTKRADDLPLDVEEILANIRNELVRLTEGGKVPDKAAVDALGSLARALKAFIELARENTVQPAPAADPVAVKPEELRDALARIDRRINELADVRAAEIIQRRHEGQFEGQSGDGGGQGVVLPGA
ncbi:hypothetical protein C5748_01170 [Phyllobacterium phragmitis]|uniref:Uncharacterized protein n=1 Tax=Phyllobacterium phragmitis TaxID=2670329 RepID=A0A2S9IZ37_9HYPH|nr:hypothetical protein [Phyllobacterium phragmitis]PRD45793.1 hypothetical protein C5748_01170 [Phyllobacterium phragmitis]